MRDMNEAYKVKLMYFYKKLHNFKLILIVTIIVYILVKGIKLDNYTS